MLVDADESDAESQEDDTDVLNAVIGQEALEIMLGDSKENA